MQTWLKQTLTGAAAAAVICASIWAAAAGSGAPTRTIQYAGRLDFNSQPWSGLATMTIHLWDDPNAGTEVFTQAYPQVSVFAGHFAVAIGPIASDAPFNASTLYASIDVATCSAPGVCAAVVPLLGRQPIAPAAQAIRASQAYNFTVSQQLSVGGSAAITGNTSTNGLVIGDVINSPSYRGVATTSQATIASYGFLQAVDGSETLVNARSGAHINLRIANATRLNVDSSGTTVDNLLATGNLAVSGTMFANGYETACGYGSQNNTFPFCCRVNVRNGDTVCRIANDWPGTSWRAMPANPFGAGVEGRYSIACYQGTPGLNYPVCCRTAVDGSASCRAATDWGFNGWGPAGTMF